MEFRRKTMFSNQIKTSKGDEYYTPRYAVEVIVPYLKARNFKRILCPFDLPQSNFVTVLKEHGFEVQHSHIAEGVDFFELEKPNVDCIVSNPPFSKRNDLFHRLFEWNIPFAMITNSNGLFDRHSRWELFKNNTFELLIPKGRMGFYTSYDSTETNSPNFQSIYVCSQVLPESICFTDMQKKIKEV